MRHERPDAFGPPQTDGARAIALQVISLDLLIQTVYRGALFSLVVGQFALEMSRPAAALADCFFGHPRFTDKRHEAAASRAVLERVFGPRRILS